MKRSQSVGHVLMLRRSCLTGKVVFVCWAKNRKAANTKYCKAKKAEKKRIRWWGKGVSNYRKWIMQVLQSHLDEMAVTDALTDSQVAAARQIQALSREDIASHREFYEHIREEERRQREDKRIREKNKQVNYRATEDCAASGRQSPVAFPASTASADAQHCFLGTL